MPRQSRRLSESGIHHVMLRGISSASIFHDAEYSEVFLQYLRGSLMPPPEDPDIPPGAPTQVYAYCLM